jgi:hypothetical protein
MNNIKRGQQVPDDFSGDDPAKWSVCVATLSQYLKLSESRILQLISDGTFWREENGAINLQAALLNYERHLFGHGLGNDRRSY